MMKSLVIIATVIVSPLLMVAASDEWQTALTQGADAALNVFVHDERGKPIPGAQVRCAFWLGRSGGGNVVYGVADQTGHFLARGRSNDDVHAKVVSEGYYASYARKVLGGTSAVDGILVRDGRWQPYGEDWPILLRKIVNPVPLDSCINRKEYHISATNAWIGFDMEKRDWVKPHGDGIQADFEINFDWDGTVRGHYTGASLDLRFPDPFSGGYWTEKTNGSDYKFAYCADTNQNFLSEFRFVVKREKQGWKRAVFGEDKLLIARTRCKVDDEGVLVAANYSQILGIDFHWGSKGKGRFFISYIRNPSVNDTNLESDEVYRLYQKHLPDLKLK